MEVKVEVYDFVVSPIGVIHGDFLNLNYSVLSLFDEPGCGSASDRLSELNISGRTGEGRDVNVGKYVAQLKDKLNDNFNTILSAILTYDFVVSPIGVIHGDFLNLNYSVLSLFDEPGCGSASDRLSELNISGRTGEGRDVNVGKYVAQLKDKLNDNFNTILSAILTYDFVVSPIGVIHGDFLNLNYSVLSLFDEPGCGSASDRLSELNISGRTGEGRDVNVGKYVAQLKDKLNDNFNTILSAILTHTVHPTSPSVLPHARSTKAAQPKVAYGSWCNPDDSPIRLELQSNTNHNVEFQDEIKPIERACQVQEPKVGLLPSYSLLKAKIAKITRPAIELQELSLPKKKVDIDKRTKTASDGENLPPIEKPQSPVPSSPSRNKKDEGYNRIFKVCDVLLPIDPQGTLYISWLFLVTFSYSYNAWCVPLRATFPVQLPDNLPYWMFMDYFCDIIYLIDVLMVKPKLMYLHDGFWVDDSAETRKNYMKKTQYKFDVISLLPLDIFYIFFGTKMVILRLPRLLKLQTFWEFHKAVDRVLSSPYVVRIGKTLFYIFFLIHLNACAYYAMSAHIGLGSNGWVYNNQGNAYIRCFYFATKTATSIGKNPKPENTVEYLFMTAAWLMGVFVFALLIGQIRDIIATATRARTEYRKTVDNCIRYLRRLNMPTYLQRRCTCWFNYTWTTQRCFDEQKILDFLPINMKRDVALAVHMSTLSKVQLFRDCSESLLRDLVLQLRPVTFLPGDLVVRRGDVGHDMYIIKCGECIVMSPDESEVLATLKEGSVFGEISLLGIDGLRRRTATVRSQGYSNLFALSRNDLDAALKHHTEAARILRLRADQIIRENAARQMKQRLLQREARKASGASSEGRRRRMSSASSHAMRVDGKRLRAASGASKRRLSVVSEDKRSTKLSMAETTEPNTVKAQEGKPAHLITTEAEIQRYTDPTTKQKQSDIKQASLPTIIFSEE